MTPFALLWAANSLLAQLDLRLETPKSAYLQYASIPITVRLKNLGSKTIELGNEGNRPWLEMIIQSTDGLLLKPDREFSLAPLTLQPGETGSVPLDIAPLYLIRDIGGYRVRASVLVPSGETLLTDSLSFFVGRGETILTLPRGEGQDLRIFSLVKFYEDPNVGLYLRVEVPEKNLVFNSRRLGTFLPLGQPRAEFDSKNHLHLLYPIVPGQYRQLVVDLEGNILREELWRESLEKIQLRKLPDGSVDVSGGVVILPSHLRERLSSLQQRAGTVSLKF